MCNRLRPVDKLKKKLLEGQFSQYILKSGRWELKAHCGKAHKNTNLFVHRLSFLWLLVIILDTDSSYFPFAGTVRHSGILLTTTT